MPPLPRPPPSDPKDAAWPIPKLTIWVDDLAHPGAQTFFRTTSPHDALRDAVVAVYCWLYTPESVPRKVEKIQLVLRSMDGVAYTLGSDLHKEIHFSLDYIARVAPAHRAKDEIMGVLVHEMVHAFQYDGSKLGNHCPGGLVEGVADWVRLRAGYAPPHWVEGRGKTWDAGYESTGFFLDWLEERYGYGTVRDLNETLGRCPYDDLIFKEVTGRKIDKLWRLYREHLSGKEGAEEDGDEGAGDVAKPAVGEQVTDAVAALSLK